jgi:hypothetical protein
MPNKTDDWLDDALDAVPTQSVPSDFRDALQARLEAEGLRVAPRIRTSEPVILRLVRPLVTAAAAALLLAVGYQLGAGGENHATTSIDTDGAIAEADLLDLYEMRDVIESWDLASDAELDPGFASMQAGDAAWVDELLDEEGR